MATWISRKCTNEILKAIAADDGLTHVFNIVGAGGTGKTILLRQIGKKFGSPNGIDACFPWSGILDLFHSEVNTNSGLEDLLSHSLEQNEEFKEYHIERQTFIKRREAGETGKELESERAKLSTIFSKCMNKVTSENRVVIALDTTERVQYEIDEIQRLCRLEGESSSVKEWLLGQLSQWKNCVVILAGRENEDLNARLAEELKKQPDVKYHFTKLGGFDKEEALEYFVSQEGEHPILKEFDGGFREQLWAVTEGKPIRLDLAIYITEQELGFDDFSHILNTLPSKERQQELDNRLIHHVMQHDVDVTTVTVFTYLAIARKGLDAQLLHYLAGEWSVGECQEKLNRISNRSFVKIRPNDGRLFLHDEVYDLCDEYMLETDDAQEKSRRLVTWYDAQLAGYGTEPNSTEVEKEKQRLQVDSLLYRLRANPQEGYQQYSMWSDEAIRYAEIGLDMRLRNELFAFLKSPSRIDKRLLSQHPDLQKEIAHNTAADWVKRYVSRGAYDKAIGVGRTIHDLADTFFESKSLVSQLARADLDVYFSQALIYSGEVDEALRMLSELIIRLEQEQLPENLAHQGNPHEFINRRLNLILGRAHNNLGYAIWTGKGQYSRALNNLRLAIPYFRASDLDEEYANTLDNMGRIYTLLYERGKAESMLEDGLAIRRKLGRKYRIALSLTSRAIGFLAFSDPHGARRFADESFGMFESLNARRGIGLSSITLGRALRKLGNTWGTSFHSLEECDRFFRESQDALERSISIFENEVREPSRLITAYNELGCTFRDRSIMKSNVQNDPDLSSSLAREAVRVLETGIDKAREKYPRLFVNCCEDLAQTYYLQNEPEKAEKWLKEAMACIPQEYLLKENHGKPKISKIELVEEYFQLLGKIELLFGYLSYQNGLRRSQGRVSREDLADAMKHFVFAYTYFDLYSKRAAERETTYKQLYERFKKCSTQDLKYLRDELIPNIAKDYGLDASTLGVLFEDTLGLVLQVES